MSGWPATPAARATAEVVALRRTAAVKTFTFSPRPQGDWVPGGEAHLDPGAYETAVLLPPGCSLEFVEVAPPLRSPPSSLWEAGIRPRITTVEDVAVTALRALDLESELPPADTPLEISAAEFEVDESLSERVRAAGLPGGALRAGGRACARMVSVNLPEPGLYTVSAFGADGAASAGRPTAAARPSSARPPAPAGGS